MPIDPGTYELGPGNGTLSVFTERTGAAAKAGHNLHFDVTSWSATVTVADDPSASAIEVTADGGSLKVIEGTGGMQSLDDDNKKDIEQTLDDEILRRQPVTFRSSKVTPTGGGWRAEGELTLLGATRPFAFDVRLATTARSAPRRCSSRPSGASSPTRRCSARSRSSTRSRSASTRALAPDRGLTPL